MRELVLGQVGKAVAEIREWRLGRLAAQAWQAI
jgi:hypothetical protein